MASSLTVHLVACWSPWCPSSICLRRMSRLLDRSDSSARLWISSLLRRFQLGFNADPFRSMQNRASLHRESANCLVALPSPSSKPRSCAPSICRKGSASCLLSQRVEGMPGGLWQDHARHGSSRARRRERRVSPGATERLLVGVAFLLKIRMRPGDLLCQAVTLECHGLQRGFVLPACSASNSRSAAVVVMLYLQCLRATPCARRVLCQKSAISPAICFSKLSRSSPNILSVLLMLRCRLPGQAPGEFVPLIERGSVQLRCCSSPSLVLLRVLGMLIHNPPKKALFFADETSSPLTNEILVDLLLKILLFHYGR